MTLKDLILKVKDESLSREDLEKYRDQLSNLFSEIQMEIADLEKEEALFLNSKGQDESVASVKIRWKASESGQRLIVLKRYALACKEMISSCKNRIYDKIY